MGKIKVYELKIKIYLLENLKLEDVGMELSSLVDKSFLASVKYKKIHKNRGYKHYSVGGILPVEKDRVFKKDGIYEFQVRTVSKDLKDYLKTNLVNEFTKNIKVLVMEEKIIPKNFFEKIYSLTPVVAKFPEGYWKDKVSFEKYEERIKNNLLKKYNDFTGEKMDEDFQLYERIELNNEYPIPLKYKNIRILGDKITLYLGSSDRAQELAYFAIGAGLLEMNPRMCGFVGYKYI